MISIQTRPKYFKAHQWDGKSTIVNENIEVVLLEHVSTTDNTAIGVVICNKQPVSQIVQSMWIIIGSKGIVQIVDDDAFKAAYSTTNVIDVEFFAINYLLAPTQ